jgi:hypothetical protein
MTPGFRVVLTPVRSRPLIRLVFFESADKGQKMCACLSFTGERSKVRSLVRPPSPVFVQWLNRLIPSLCAPKRPGHNLSRNGYQTLPSIFPALLCPEREDFTEGTAGAYENGHASYRPLWSHMAAPSSLRLGSRMYIPLTLRSLAQWRRLPMRTLECIHSKMNSRSERATMARRVSALARLKGRFAPKD